MPTVFTAYGFRFFFFSRENNEPAHIHVEKDEDYAKFWISPICLAVNYGFNSSELKRIEKLIEKNYSKIKERWDEHLNNN